MTRLFWDRWDDSDDDKWRNEDAMDAIAPLVAIKHTIEMGTGLQPSAIMVPLSYWGYESIFNIPVVRGDRFALLFEPPRRR